MMSLPARWFWMLVSAGLYGLSFPPYGSAVVAWFALVPLFVALDGLGVGAALLLSWISGLVMAYAITDFLPDAVANYYAQGPIFGMFLFVASVTVMCCLSHMLFAVWYRRPERRRGRMAPFVVGAAWVAAEFVRGDLEGNPWGTMGYTQARVLPLVQIAEYTGVYGVSFLLVASNAALTDVVQALRARRPLLRELGKVAAVAGLAVAVAGFGAARLAAVEAEPPGDVPIAVVQGNIDLGARWRSDLYGQNLKEYLLQTRDSVREDPAEIVFWPENAMTFFVEDEPLYRASIAQVIFDPPTQLVAGGPSKVSGARQVRNSAFLLEPSGEVVARYDKRVLLPFAEYYPAWLGWFVRRDFDGVREFTAGEETPPLPTAAGAASVVTCNEALFPRTVNQRVAQGSDYLVSLANDGWLGVHKYSDRVLDMVALRAIEHRRYVVRASSSGGSAIIAPSGRVLARADDFAAETLRGAIRPRRDVTPYGRLGDVFVALCVVAVSLSAWRGSRSRSRSRSS